MRGIRVCGLQHPQMALKWPRHRAAHRTLRHWSLRSDEQLVNYDRADAQRCASLDEVSELLPESEVAFGRDINVGVQHVRRHQRFSEWAW